MQHFNVELKELYPFLGEDGRAPRLEAFLPDNVASKYRESDLLPAILVLPGGGYGFTSDREGEPIALRFLSHGYNVFILWYSVEPHHDPVQIVEVAAAADAIRKNAGAWHVDADKLVIMGFSAGGHLAAYFSNRYDCEAVREHFPDGLGVNACVLGYPVITSGEYTHIYSMQALLGLQPTPEELEYFSLEKQVKENTPPCFLWQTLEDNLVPVENTYLFAKALKEKGVPYAQYVYPHGGHGLSTASMELFSGWHGGEYVCEQIGFALERIKNNTAVNMNPRRRAELVAQFHLEPAEGEANAPAPGPGPGFEPPKTNPFADVATWVELSRIWFERFL